MPLPLTPTPTPVDKRKDILFVGSLEDTGHACSPNRDGLIWFLENVWLQVREETTASLIIAGPGQDKSIQRQSDEYVIWRGVVEDLFPLYDTARLVVAPGRVAASIPLKICNAASHGVPVVTTSLLAAQLDWQNETELLVADEPSAFAERCLRLYTDSRLWEQLRKNALHRVEQECSRTRFLQTLQQTLEAP